MELEKNVRKESMQMKELWRDWAVLENSMTFSVREVLGPKKFVGIE